MDYADSERGHSGEKVASIAYILTVLKRFRSSSTGNLNFSLRPMQLVPTAGENAENYSERISRSTV
jgi:hypothetical protein